MEKIAIKGSGGGGGGTTFEIVSTPTIVMSSTGTDGDLTLKDGATTNNFYFNLIGGQFLGINTFLPDFSKQSSKSPYRSTIENGTIYFAIGDVTSDDGSSIDCSIGFYDGEGNTLDTQQITLTQNQYFNYMLFTWDGDISNKNIYIRIGTIEPYTFASLQIGGWSFGIR